MIYNGIYIVEENILDSIKNLFNRNRTKNEHILIGLIANDKSAIEKLLTEEPNPVFSKDEFKANKSNYLKLVKNSIPTVLAAPLNKECVIYDITGYKDGFFDDDDLYHFVDAVSDYDENSISSDHLENFKRTLNSYKKGLPELEKNYKKYISETLNKSKLYSELFIKLKPMILKKSIGSAINDLNKCIKNVDKHLPLADDASSFGRFVKELRTLLLARLTIQLNIIEFAIKHNESVADEIVSKIKSQVQKDLKPNTTNESMILYELAMVLEDL